MFDLSKDPFENFQSLFTQAQEKNVPETNAMSVATVSADGTPSVRIVYLKEVSKGGFVFYGNYHSHKGKDLELNSKVCLNFHWPVLWQQVRITGHVEKLSDAENDAYFASRPRLSQIGAWASLQSEEIPSIEWLQSRVNEYEQKFADQPVPRPSYWGGWRVIPAEIEFWFGVDGRLHRRYIYQKTESGWKTLMRSP